MTCVTLNTDGRGIATMTLSRPEKRNALSGEMIERLAALVKDVATNDDIRVLILAAADPVFCSGGDLAWMRAQMVADAGTRRKEATALAMMLKALNEIPKPVVARVQGDAFGGGLGLMAVCDAVIATDNARFGLTETRLGLIPATIGPYVVARVGVGQARRFYVSPRLFGAEEAKDLGLVSRIVSDKDLDDAIEEEVLYYLKAAPGAVAEGKALLRRLAKPIDQEVIDASIDALVARWESPEAEEGTRAFFDKRRPLWDVD